MWHSLSEWAVLKDNYEKTLFSEVDDQEITKTAEKHGKISNRLEKNLPENAIQ